MAGHRPRQNSELNRFTSCRNGTTVPAFECTDHFWETPIQDQDTQRQTIQQDTAFVPLGSIRTFAARHRCRQCGQNCLWLCSCQDLPADHGCIVQKAESTQNSGLSTEGRACQQGDLVSGPALQQRRELIHFIKRSNGVRPPPGQISSSMPGLCLQLRTTNCLRSA